MRDIDNIAINALQDYMIKLDIDIETVGDFNIDKAKIIGFSECQQGIRDILDEKA
jgi:hypothetical protein